MSQLPFVSVVIPVLNGADRLPDALASLRQQDYPRDRFEVIVADGGSTDGTRDFAVAGGARVVDNPKRREAPGRNAGFAAARGEIIAFTDDDCTFPPDWIRRAVEQLHTGEIAGVSGPTMIPERESAFGRAVAFLFELGTSLARSVHRERVATVAEVTDLPGCNAFFRREALAKVMPSDDALVTGEDILFSYRVRKLGYRLVLVPQVKVWHAKRQGPRRLFRQMARFAVGRLQVGKLHPELLRPAHVLVGLSLPALVACAVALVALAPEWAAPAAAAGCSALLGLGCWGGVRRGSAAVGAWVPAVILLAVTGWSLGFVREVVLPYPRSVPESGNQEMAH
jgi:GT2 family glycosyltransferase